MNDLFDQKYSDYSSYTKIGRDGRPIRTRRKRSDVVGRDYRCDQCPNAYFSAQALYNHKKIKHDYIPSVRKQGRRDHSYSEEDNCYDQYRKDPASDFIQYFVELKNYLIADKKANFRFRLFEPSDNDLFRAIAGRLKERRGEELNLADVFAEYLIDKKNKENPNVYRQTLKILFLFLDSINRFGEDEVDKQIAWDNAENMPLFVNNFFGFYAKEEAICEILKASEAVKCVLEFCNWAYEKEYTNYRLSKFI